MPESDAGILEAAAEMSMSRSTGQSASRPGQRRGKGRRALLLSTLSLFCLCGCIDTAPGLVVDAREGSLVVAADGSIMADLRLGVRVGQYALDGRSFITPRVDLFVADEGIAQVNLDRPLDFSGELSPGESREVLLHGASPAAAWPRARELCDAQVTMLAQWQAETAPSDPTDPARMEFGSVSLVTTDVRCE